MKTDDGQAPALDVQSVFHHVQDALHLPFKAANSSLIINVADKQSTFSELKCERENDNWPLSPLDGFKLPPFSSSAQVAAKVARRREKIRPSVTSGDRLRALSSECLCLPSQVDECVCESSGRLRDSG